MKDFRINFGWSASGTIAEQLAEQGLKVKKDCEDVVEMTALRVWNCGL